MNATNLNIVLTNALCCISAQAVKVSKLYSIGSKCADSELQKLKLMNDWFEALRCYKPDPITSLFQLRVDYDDGISIFKEPSNINVEYIIVVNGVQYGIQGDGTTLIVDLLVDILNSIDSIIDYSLTIDPDRTLPRYMTLRIEADCDVTSMRTMRIKNGDDILGDKEIPLVRTGQCTPINCLTEEQFEIIVAKLMKECDICECQLTQ